MRGEIVELGVAEDFGGEDGGCEEGHDGHGDVGLLHFEADLMFEEFGVFESRFVVDENVRERGADEVDEEPEDPGYQEQGRGLSVDIVSRPSAAVCPFGRLEGHDL